MDIGKIGGTILEETISYCHKHDMLYNNKFGCEYCILERLPEERHNEIVGLLTKILAAVETK